ncbi:hypothetical protein [Arcticibacter tournemirensis]|uniref:hypothetical protein n=1 Tax=Arcticibacter tournemirensis TaxID=699437 RepID=UPI001386F044|nr:hypothetical protein [Arcticibacter tournemirensis]
MKRIVTLNLIVVYVNLSQHCRIDGLAADYIGTLKTKIINERATKYAGSTR